MKLVKLTAVFAFVAVMESALASIIDNGSYTTDTVAGLDWLDVTQSVNMSYQYVSAQIGTGGLFSGWRYATGAEFNSLVENYTGIAIPTREILHK